MQDLLSWLSQGSGLACLLVAGVLVLVVVLAICARHPKQWADKAMEVLKIIFRYPDDGQGKP